MKHHLHLIRKEEEVAEKKDWRWMTQHLPVVAGLLADKRAILGPAWVGQCWHEGVVLGKPGWFFAAQGAVAVGAPTAAQMIEWYEVHARDAQAGAVLYLADPHQPQSQPMGGQHAGA